MKTSEVFEAKLRSRYPDGEYPALCVLVLQQMKKNEEHMALNEEMAKKLTTPIGIDYWLTKGNEA
jgi:hypothetical protein